MTTLLLLADVFKSQNKPDAAVKCHSEASDLVANFSAGDLLSLPEIVIPQMLDAGLQHQLMAVCHRVLALNPTNAVFVADVCWYLITAEKAPGLDTALIVALVQKAAAATGRRDAYILDALATVEAWAGDFTNAVRIEQEASALLPDGEDKKNIVVRLKRYESNTRYQDCWVQAWWASARLTEGNSVEAKSLARESLALSKKLAIDEWGEFDHRGLVGVILLERKKYAEAESFLLSAYDGLKQREDTIPAIYRHLLNGPIRQLVRLYEATGQPEKAKEWRAKLPTLARAHPGTAP